MARQESGERSRERWQRRQRVTHGSRRRWNGRPMRGPRARPAIRQVRISWQSVAGIPDNYANVASVDARNMN